MRKARQGVLYVHLFDAAVTNGGLDHRLGRLENTRNLITAEQVRAWCGSPDTHVTVKPVIHLNDHVHVERYEVPDRMAEAAALVDVTCVFPFCTCDLAPLCRRHHRLKTHGGWRYAQVERGTYLWTSPLGLSFLRDHEGTLDVTRDRSNGPIRACAHPPDR